MITDTLNPNILETLDTHNIQCIGNPADVVMMSVSQLHALLSDVYLAGETEGYMTGFYEAELE